MMVTYEGVRLTPRYAGTSIRTIAPIVDGNPDNAHGGG
jgi:hypothetical protein